MNVEQVPPLLSRVRRKHRLSTRRDRTYVDHFASTHFANVPSVFSSARMYALCHRSIFAGALVGLLSLIPIGTNAVSLQQHQ